MKAINVFSLILAILISSACEGYEEQGLVAGEALFESSDVVALVRIDKGEVSPSSYHLTGSIERLYKGEIDGNSISFGHKIGTFSDEPHKLGARYLVFLALSKSGFESKRNAYSVIEVGTLASDREDLDIALERLNINMEMTSNYGTNILVFPVRCEESSQKLCDIVKENLAYALNAGESSKSESRGQRP